MALSDGCASRTMPIAFISLSVSTVLSILNTNGRFPVVLSGIIYAKYFCMAVSGYTSLTVLFSASSSIVFFCFVLLLISASSFNISAFSISSESVILTFIFSDSSVIRTELPSESRPRS